MVRHVILPEKRALLMAFLKKKEFNTKKGVLRKTEKDIMVIPRWISCQNG